MSGFNSLSASEQRKIGERDAEDYLPKYLVALTGSAKQVAWAEQERTKILRMLATRAAIESHRAADGRHLYQAVARDIVLSALNYAAEVPSTCMWICVLRTQDLDRLIRLLGTERGRKELAKYR